MLQLGGNDHLKQWHAWHFRETRSQNSSNLSSLAKAYTPHLSKCSSRNAWPSVHVTYPLKILFNSSSLLATISDTSFLVRERPRAGSRLHRRLFTQVVSSRNREGLRSKVGKGRGKTKQRGRQGLELAQTNRVANLWISTKKIQLETG